jgi:GntR family transcriptional regulator/MocR family aminotransferase
MLIPLKLVRDQPLQQQLYDQLRDLIVSSRLAAGTRMPSTRMLADQFSISRMTALLAYERLIAEGYLRTIPAKGTFVHRTHSTAARAPAHSGRQGEQDTGTDIHVGRPDGRLFPAAKWRALIRTALDRLGASLSDDHPEGDPALRAAIGRWLSTSRGLSLNADQIVLAHSRQHALHIATHVLLRPGSRAIIENPCDAPTEMLLAGTGAAVVKIPVDDNGIITDRLPNGAAAMALVTPEHQRPLGAVMSLQRRHDLLAWAARSGATVIEEDSDGELRYEAMDAPALMSLGQDGCVIHAGGFATSLGPGMMLGYLAVPSRLIGPARAASRLVGAYAGHLEGDALASLLDSGAYARHLHGIRKVYLNRRDVMVRSLRRHFGDDARVGGTSAGLHVAWTVPAEMGSAAAVAGLARQFGLEADRAGDRIVLLGFGMHAERQLEISIGRFADAVSGVAATMSRSGG